MVTKNSEDILIEKIRKYNRPGRLDMSPLKVLRRDSLVVHHFSPFDGKIFELDETVNVDIYRLDFTAKSEEENNGVVARRNSYCSDLPNRKSVKKSQKGPHLRSCRPSLAYQKNGQKMSRIKSTSNQLTPGNASPSLISKMSKSVSNNNLLSTMNFVQNRINETDARDIQMKNMNTYKNMDISDHKELEPTIRDKIIKTMIGSSSDRYSQKFKRTQSFDIINFQNTVDEKAVGTVLQKSLSFDHALNYLDENIYESLERGSKESITDISCTQDDDTYLYDNFPEILTVDGSVMLDGKSYDDSVTHYSNSTSIATPVHHVLSI